MTSQHIPWLRERRVLIMHAALVVMLMQVHAANASTNIVASPDSFKASQFKHLNTTVDPDSHVYGLAFGSTEAQAVSLFLAPTGIIQLDKNTRAYLYGKKHVLIFTNGKLSDLYVKSWSALDHDVAQSMAVHPFFDSITFTLRGGITFAMSPKDVAKRLGITLPRRSSEITHITKNAIVTFAFSHQIKNLLGFWKKTVAYNLYDVHIRFTAIP